MRLFLIVVFLSLASFALIALWARWRADEAVASGELRYWSRGEFRHRVIYRDADPTRFDIEIRILRAVPWITAALVSLGILVMGFVA